MRRQAVGNFAQASLLRQPPRQHAGASSARLSESYDEKDLISSGAFGKVFRGHAKHASAETTVAIKRILVAEEDDATDPDSWWRREFELLRALQPHEHVVPLLDVFVSPRTLVLVMDYCEDTLHTMMRKNALVDVRSMAEQLLCGVAHCHELGMVHRDLKPSNVLVRGGVLKLGDFGLCRRVATEGRPMTPRVVTLWYRAPEVLLSDGQYGTAVDVWSCGCIVSEMGRRKPLFVGDHDFDILIAIFRLRGTPREEEDRALTAQLPHFSADCFPKWRTAEALQRLRALHESSGLDGEGVDLVDRMLSLDATARITAAEALRSAYLASATRKRVRTEEAPVECS